MAGSNGNHHRRLPSVDRVLREMEPSGLPRPTATALTREVLRALRDGGIDDSTDAMSQVSAAAKALRAQAIRPVINATGVIIHTNLGRAPLCPAAVRALAEAAENYSTIEYDLAAGERGGRGGYVERSLAVLCRAEAATVVNNCAAALVLMLLHFASRGPRKRVIISRGELVQIGGGFRIPDILHSTGAILHEVGTTNITTVDDYARAIGPETAMMLKVHQSNFFQGGFAQAPAVNAIATVAHQAGLPMVVDVGSGAFFDTATLGGETEPTPADVLAAGADLVCFSGDKLFGGPQAGIIAGASEHVAALKAEPVFRALRCDKLVLSALQATADLLLNEGTAAVPVREMMNMPLEAIRRRAERAAIILQAAGCDATLGEGRSQIGGGALPRTSLQSVTVDVAPRPGQTVEELARALRVGDPPVIAYVSKDRVRMDPRTIFPAQDEQWISAIIAARRP